MPAAVRVDGSNYNNNAWALYLMDRCAVFIDGGYLAAILRKKGSPKIDFQKLSERLSIDMIHLRTYYYTSMPFQSNPPTADEKQRYSKVSRFVNQLKKIPRFEVKLGRLQKTRDGRQDHYTQKGVDMMLGVDLVRMSWDKQIQRAVIVTADSDFVYAVQAAKDAGVITQLCYSNELPVNQSLLDVFDESMLFTQAIIDTCRYNSP